MRVILQDVQDILQRYQLSESTKNIILFLVKKSGGLSCEFNLMVKGMRGQEMLKKVHTELLVEGNLSKINFRLAELSASNSKICIQDSLENLCIGVISTKNYQSEMYTEAHLFEEALEKFKESTFTIST